MTEQAGATPAPDTGSEWRKLSIRVVWVDFAKTIITVLPAVIAIFLFNVDPSFNAMWPFVAVAVWGVIGAVTDIVRWAFTRYRVTDTEVERRTGLFVKRHRSVKRDRIRSVDSHARLRHRLGGLRVVTIGAGQQMNAGESAFVLDSLTRADAALLRRTLLRERAETASDPRSETEKTGHDADSQTEAEVDRTDVFARLNPAWVFYNMFSIVGYVLIAGLLWGAYWLASTFNINLIDISSRWIAWDELDWVGITIIAIIGGGICGAIGMAITFFLENWNFELARVHTGNTTYLRTRRGLLNTREVNRDEARTRGLSISEPLVWRWIRMADTNLITTGLSIWDPGQPSTILPRGPRSVAERVAVDVLGNPSPLATSLVRHPRAALRRRLWWATVFTLAIVAAVAVPVATRTVPLWVLWAAIAVWPAALGLAVVAYRALGHAIVGEYLVVRSGFMQRTTSALQRDAVSTIAVRQSLLQRRLGLSTVSAMTAAGWAKYEALDVASADATRLASRAAPGLLDEFLETSPAPREGDIRAR